MAKGPKPPPPPPKSGKAAPAQARSPGVAMAVMTYMLNCDERTVQKYAAAGLAVRVGRGLYAPLDTARNIITHLRARAEGRESKDGQVDAVTENALLRRAQREIIEMQRDQKAGQLISISELEALWSALVTGERRMIESIPDQIAAEFPDMGSFEIARMKAVCERVLRESALPPKLGPLPDPPTE
jgi:phage terminase Nu1 subunit (DNA packaging protein)